ncbi:MAG: flagellar protein FlaG [Bermanella sp.]
MSEIKANMNRVESQPGSMLTTAPPANARVQVEKTEVTAAEKSGQSLPLENVAKVAAETDSQQVEHAVSKLNEYVQNTARSLNFQVDDESGKTVIKVYDRESDQLIRQIPNELVLELARRLNEEEPSLLFEAQV